MTEYSIAVIAVLFIIFCHTKKEDEPVIEIQPKMTYHHYSMLNSEDREEFDNKKGIIIYNK